MDKAKYHIIDTLKHKAAVMSCYTQLIENTTDDTKNSLLKIATDVVNEGVYESYDITLNALSVNTYQTWCDHDNDEVDASEFVLGTLALNCMEHDNSKIGDFREYVAYRDVVYKLKGLEYGTSEFNDAITELDYGFEIHASNNDHHPEHYGMDLCKMNLFTFTEMILDWCAAAICRGFKFKMSSISELKKEELGLSDTLVEIIKDNVRLILPKDKIEE